MTLPNILFIMTDQQRWDTLGCYGNRVIETSNLDWLASEGTVFRCAYTPSPSCGLPIPDTVDGRSMLGLMGESDPNWREYVHGEHSTCYSEEQEMQYLTDDPGETVNLAERETELPELLKGSRTRAASYGAYGRQSIDLPSG